MKKILIILMGVLLVYGEPVIAKNELTGITIAKKISKAKKKTSQKKKKVKSAKNKVVKKKYTKAKKVSYGKAYTYNKGEIQSYAHSLVLSYGWSEEDYQALVLLWYRESSWNPNSVNEKSGACGIPQARPCSKMAKYGSDYRTNWRVQVKWGLDYIKEVYTTPSEAYRKFLKRKPHWY